MFVSFDFRFDEHIQMSVPMLGEIIRHKYKKELFMASLAGHGRRDFFCWNLTLTDYTPWVWLQWGMNAQFRTVHFPVIALDHWAVGISHNFTLRRSLSDKCAPPPPPPHTHTHILVMSHSMTTPIDEAVPHLSLFWPALYKNDQGKTKEPFWQLSATHIRPVNQLMNKEYSVENLLL